MTALLTTLAIIYGLGVAIVAITALGSWNIDRDLQREYRDELRNPTERFQRLYSAGFAQEQYDVYQRTMNEAARRFVRAPLWPVDALAMLGRILTDAKADRS